MDGSDDRFWDAQLGRLLAGHREPAIDDARLRALGEALADRLAAERTTESNLASMLRHYEEPEIDPGRLEAVGKRLTGMLGAGRAPEPSASRPASSGRWKAVPAARRSRRTPAPDDGPALRWWAAAAAAALLLLAAGAATIPRKGPAPRPEPDLAASVVPPATEGSGNRTRESASPPEPRVVRGPDDSPAAHGIAAPTVARAGEPLTPAQARAPEPRRDDEPAPPPAGPAEPVATDMSDPEPAAAPPSRVPAGGTQTVARPAAVVLARLERMTGVVHVAGPDDPTPARAGASIRSGQSVRTGEGAARALVRYPDGTRMELGAETEATLGTADDGGKRVVLSRGSVVADVTKQTAGSPMRFATASAEAVVLGTRLRFAATAGATRLDVQEGRVRLARAADGASVEVGAGQFAVALDGVPMAAHASAPPPPRAGEPAVMSFTLINAETDQPVPGLDPIENGAVLNLAALPTRKLNIRANTQPEKVGSVLFVLDGRPRDRAEWRAPYALFGDATKGDYEAWTPAAGEHTLSAVPYEHADARGQAGRALTLVFYVVAPRAR